MVIKLDGISVQLTTELYLYELLIHMCYMLHIYPFHLFNTI